MYPQSDQYSLAVTYCYLRGGRLPFQGSAAQLTAGHLMQPPDLSMIPEAERPAITRALAKEPKDRWPSCRAFIEALAPAAQAGVAAAAAETITGHSPPGGWRSPSAPQVGGGG